jgi:geranylgeranyl diphosphate synthase type II
LDLEAEGQPFRKEQVEAIHAAKTGALLSRRWLGAYLAGPANRAERVAPMERKIGLAFQIVDDILDETESGETLGKTAGKDREDRKATWPAVFGLDESRRMVRQLTEEACQIVQPFITDID